MEIKKATTFVVETMVTSDGNVSFTVRLMSGHPIKVCATPVELTAVFQELSADDGSQDSNDA